MWQVVPPHDLVLATAHTTPVMAGNVVLHMVLLPVSHVALLLCVLWILTYPTTNKFSKVITLLLSSWKKPIVHDPRAARPYLFSDGKNIYNQVVLVCTGNVYIPASLHSCTFKLVQKFVWKIKYFLFQKFSCKSIKAIFIWVISGFIIIFEHKQYFSWH